VRSAVAARHVGGGPGLVQEHEACGVYEALPDAPASALGGDMRNGPAGGSQGLFLRRSLVSGACRGSSRVPRRYPRGAEAPSATRPVRCPAAPRRVGADPSPGAPSAAGDGRQKRIGAAHPVMRTRCISLIAADGLTAKRRAVSRIELPLSTAPTIRSRDPTTSVSTSPHTPLES
jgi:hypothetical protein